MPPDAEARDIAPGPPLDAAIVGAPASAPTPGAPDAALVLVEALSIAWATFTLYDDPRGLEAFRRAVDTLGTGPAYPWRIEVGAEGFSAGGIAVASRREAARRLSRQIFAHGAAAVEIVSPPTADDLIGLFTLLVEDPGDEDAAELLFASGVTSIALLARELLLREAEDASASEFGETTVWCTEYDGDAEPFVHTLLAEMPDDPPGLAMRFVDEYERVFALISRDDHWAREEVVHTFVDAFSFLPRRHQAAALDLLLARQDHHPCLIFLDQLGGQELGDLARHLAPEAHPLLIEYARIAAEQGERRHGELLRLLAESEPSKPVGQTVAEKVGAALSAAPGTVGDDARSALQRLRDSVPTARDNAATGIKVMRGLMSLARGSEGLLGVSRVWASKTACAIRDGDLEEADRWLAVAGGLGLEPADQTILLRALADEVDPALVDRVVSLVRHRPESGPGTVLLRAAPLFLIEGLIEQLGEEEEAGRRKPLVDALASLAPYRPDALMPHLEDPRWFVVRNVVLALGWSHRPDLAPRIERLRHHPDHRVRREVLRASRRLRGVLDRHALMAALADPHPEVRSEAVALVERSDDPTIDEALVEALDRGESVEVRLAAAAALGRRDSKAGRRALNRLAARRFAVRPSARALRRAARAALSSRGEEAP